VPDVLIAHLADPTRQINLARAISPWRESEMRSNIAGPAKAGGLINASPERQRNVSADAWHGHQQLADIVPSRQRDDAPIEDGPLPEQLSSGCEQRFDRRHDLLVVTDPRAHLGFEMATAEWQADPIAT
jgi:hypothetical protein